MGWLSRFKKQKTTLENSSEAISNELTFKARVEEFWNWYASVADRFYETIEAGKCRELVSEVSPKVAELLPGFGWVFGPGANHTGHSFTLTPEADKKRAFLAKYWLSQAPKLAGWTFYDARQPGNIDGSAIRIGGEEFEANAVWLTPNLNDDGEKIDISVWHPLFAKLERNQQFQVLFLWLDEALGEKGTDRWIGNIEVSENEFRGAIPISELREYAESVEQSKGWNTQENIGSVYDKEPIGDNLRSDIFLGVTLCYPIVSDYFENCAPHPENPLMGLGAEFLFLAVDRSNISDDDLLGSRNEIEKSFESVFSENRSGAWLGGATGTRNVYIDLLIFDGERTIEQIRNAVRKFDFSYPVSLHPFYQSEFDSIEL